MKLLIVVNSLALGGAERVAANMANYYSERGTEVRIATFSAITDFYELGPHVTIVRLNEKRSGNLLLKTFHRIIFIRRQLKIFKPDCTLGILTEPSVLLALAKIGFPGIFIGSEHSYPAFFHMGFVREWARKLAYGNLDAITALTKDAAKWIADNTKAKKVIAIPNSISWPLPQFNPTLLPETYIKDESKVLLGVGRLSYEKGMIFLIEAFAKISAQNPEWTCIIIGEGDERPLLEKRIRDLNQIGRIMLPGKAGNVEAWYRRASLYAMTSRVEGFGNTLVEAMGSGVPCVSFDSDSGPRDIITHGVDGELIKVGDTEQLAKRLNELMSNDELRKHYSQSYMKIRERYSNANVYRKWNAIFNFKDEKHAK